MNQDSDNFMGVTSRLEAARATSKQSINRSLRRVLGVLGTFPIPVAGFAFSWAAVITIALIPIKTVRGWPLYIKTVLVLVGLGSIALTVSARVNRAEMPTESLYSFMALGLMLVAAVKLSDGVASASHFLAWVAVGTALFYVVIGNDKTRDTFEHLWKYALAIPVAFFLVWFVVSRSDRRSLPILVLTGIAFYSIFLGFRSHGLVCLVVVLLLFVKGKSRSRGQGFFKAVAALLAFAALAVILPVAINSGLFGDTVRARTEEQEASGASLLLAGRTEPPLSFAAIAEKPFLGWGNVNNLGMDTLAHGRQIASSLGMNDPSAYMNFWVRSDGRVSVHSVFFEAWVQGGVIAMLVPLSMVILFALGIAKSKGRWAPFIVLIGVQGIWDVFFSTWGIGRPATLALTTVVVAWCLTDARASRDTDSASERQIANLARSRRDSVVRVVDARPTGR